MGPLGVFLRIAIATLVAPAALVAFMRGPIDPAHPAVWGAVAAGAVVGLFGAAVESTEGVRFSGVSRFLWWSVLSVFTIWIVSVALPGFGFSLYPVLFAGGAVGLVQWAVPPAVIRS